jgi:hypothetical protein
MHSYAQSLYYKTRSGERPIKNRDDDVVYLNQNNELCCDLLHIRPYGIGGESRKNLAEQFEQMRIELNINREELAWLLTDGANNMLGEFNSLAADVKSKEGTICMHSSYCMNHWFG